MLQQFFVILLVLLVFIKVWGIIKINWPVNRFIEKADAVINIYNLFEMIRKHHLSNERVEIVYEKYNFTFSNPNEFYTEFEEFVKKTLADYEKIEWLLDDELKELKNQLVEICRQVRMSRWQLQGI